MGLSGISKYHDFEGKEQPLRRHGGLRLSAEVGMRGRMDMIVKFLGQIAAYCMLYELPADSPISIHEIWW
jgi:hypothetical protein